MLEIEDSEGKLHRISKEDLRNLWESVYKIMRNEILLNQEFGGLVDYYDGTLTISTWNKGSKGEVAIPWSDAEPDTIGSIHLHPNQSVMGRHQIARFSISDRFNHMEVGGVHFLAAEDGLVVEDARKNNDELPKEILRYDTVNDEIIEPLEWQEGSI